MDEQSTIFDKIYRLNLLDKLIQKDDQGKKSTNQIRGRDEDYENLIDLEEIIFKKQEVFDLLNSNSKQEQLKIINKKMGKVQEESLKIISNYGLQVINFAKENYFTVQKAGLILNVAYFILCSSIQKKLTANEVVYILDVIINKYNFQAPPYSIQILEQQEGHDFREFILEYFVEMFSFYQISLTKFIDYNLYTYNIFEEKMPKIIPLDNGEVQEINSQLLLIEQYLQEPQSQIEESLEVQQKNDQQQSVDIKDNDVSQILEFNNEQEQQLALNINNKMDLWFERQKANSELKNQKDFKQLF